MSYHTLTSSFLSSVRALCVFHDLLAECACRPGLLTAGILYLLRSPCPDRPYPVSRPRARAIHLACVGAAEIASSRIGDTLGSNRRCRGGQTPGDSHWGMTRLEKSVVSVLMCEFGLKLETHVFVSCMASVSPRLLSSTSDCAKTFWTESSSKWTLIHCVRLLDNRVLEWWFNSIM